MNELVTDASVWSGKELVNRPDWLHELTEQEITELRTAVDTTSGPSSKNVDRDTFLLPMLANRLKKIQNSLEFESGATLIRGFPVKQLSQPQITNAFLSICHHIGTPVSQSATGETVFHVQDSGYQDDDPRTRGPNTNKKLSFHTDRCDVIGFLCLKQAQEGGENCVVSSSQLYNQIARKRPDLLFELKQPFYYKRHNVDLGNQSPSCRQPIFSFTADRFACSFLRVLIDRAYASHETPAMTARQLEALDFLEEICEQPENQYRFYQQPGDILLLNNWTTLHRRSEFVDHVDPAEKRHLLRVWLSVPNSRPIDPLFQDNFGATEAGALRGGMRACS